MNVAKFCDPLVEPTQSRRKKDPSILDEFFGVYCLISRSMNRAYKNRCYVGYTVDPNRRERQHNAGKDFGGAKKTDNRGPWDMVCIVHGFPNSVSALRFEWAWQNPLESKRIRDLLITKAGRKESPFEYHLRIVCHMLNVDPWKRLSLTFRWLVDEEKRPFPIPIPPHMTVEHGKVTKTHSLIPQELKEYVMPGTCLICKHTVHKISDLLQCLTDSCRSSYHTRCLAEHGLSADELNITLFPLKVKCIQCKSEHRWGDLVRRQRCFLAMDNVKPVIDGFKVAQGMIPKFVRKSD
ncbi:unnamed protein product [Bursaphelenchus xylophilus]|uniref:Structure-specific endonuclease subunit SLX1 homolog n=1 Tax=Bursaphelenchus xylophilus TaxID=6326 RepID=A0A1I7RL77_BURXY|nr:unnamed protein product [Bursaphelenchus xylophilus]CAG9083343.1 unnamed protein product [Bursaphelenchus xylophilus]